MANARCTSSGLSTHWILAHLCCISISLYSLLLFASFASALPVGQENDNLESSVTGGALTLASDIAPLVQLIGARPLEQFFAYSVGNKRGLFTLFGTIGIVTLMSIYIRAHSFSWLRYMIGRAGEPPDEVLQSVFRIPQIGNATFWNQSGGVPMTHDGRAQVFIRLRPGTKKAKRTPNAFDLRVSRSPEKGTYGAAVDDKSKPSVSIVPSVSSGEDVVDEVNRVVEAWPQISPTTISRTRLLNVDGELTLVCCTTALGTATLRNRLHETKMRLAFSVACALTVAAQGALVYFMWKVDVPLWLIITGHATYYGALALVLWRLLCVDDRRSIRTQLDKYGYQVHSLRVLQPGVLSGDSTMPEWVSFQSEDTIDFMMAEAELDNAMLGKIGHGKSFDSSKNGSRIREFGDSLLLLALIVGYLLYFIALSSMNSLRALIVLGIVGPSLFAKGIVNTFEANAVKPRTVSIAVGRSDASCALVTCAKPRMTSGDLSALHIRIVLQLKIQNIELEPALRIPTTYDGWWLSLLPVAETHRRHSPEPLIAFKCVPGVIPLGLLVRLWLISGDICPHTDLPERSTTAMTESELSNDKFSTFGAPGPSIIILNHQYL